MLKLITELTFISNKKEKNVCFVSKICHLSQSSLNPLPELLFEFIVSGGWGWLYAHAKIRGQLWGLWSQFHGSIFTSKIPCYGQGVWDHLLQDAVASISTHPQLSGYIVQPRLASTPPSCCFSLPAVVYLHAKCS